MTNDELETGARLLAAATPGPCFVSLDDAEECGPHRNSGLAMVDTGRDGDWPIARLCEWPDAELTAWLRTHAAELIADAARYQWLLSNNWQCGIPATQENIDIRITFSNDGLTAAIDAARASGADK